MGTATGIKDAGKTPWDTMMEELRCSKELPKCGGKFYRFRVNNFIADDGRIIRRESLVPLKRISCKFEGCPECEFIDELLNDEYQVYNGEEVVPFLPENGKHGELYEIYVGYYGSSYYNDDYEYELELRLVEDNS